jgi:hypothetical protein
LIITLAWTISVYDPDADLHEDTYKPKQKPAAKPKKAVKPKAAKPKKVKKPKKTAVKKQFRFFLKNLGCP